MEILIPGGTGQVGNVLYRAFTAAGHKVTIVSRNHSPTYANLAELIETTDVVINLAGRSVNCRYSPANRQPQSDHRLPYHHHQGHRPSHSKRHKTP